MSMFSSYYIIVAVRSSAYLGDKNSRLREDVLIEDIIHENNTNQYQKGPL